VCWHTWPYGFRDFSDVSARFRLNPWPFPRVRFVRLSLLKRDERASDHKVSQPNQRARGDDGRCAGGKNADSIKKEDRVHLGIDEQAAHRASQPLEAEGLSERCD
jgi:hypothetical protein